MPMDVLPQLPPSIQRLLAFIGDTADGAFVVSLDCQFLAWSWRAQNLFGFSSSEILGRYCYDVLPAGDECGRCLCNVNCPMVTEARSGHCVPPADVQIRAKGNRPIWVRVSPVILRTVNGTTCAILVLATDVNRYKLTEQAVRLISSRLNGGAIPADIPAAIPAKDGATLLRSRFRELTSREAEVLWEAVIGEDYHEIAQALGISGTTVRNHLQRVLEKLGVHSTRKAVLRALLAIITPSTPAPGDPEPTGRILQRNTQ